MRGPARQPICPARQQRSSVACAHLPAGMDVVPRRRYRRAEREGYLQVEVERHADKGSWKPCLQERPTERENGPKRHHLKPSLDAPTEMAYAVARPAFCQTSALTYAIWAAEGDAADFRATKVAMDPPKTTLCVSVAQPATVIFWLASVALAKVMVVPARLDVTSASASPLKTMHIVPDVAATVSWPQASGPYTPAFQLEPGDRASSPVPP